LIEFCLRLNLQSRAYTGALTDRTGVPNGNLSERKVLVVPVSLRRERIDEPTKSTSRTVAKEAERQHRRALEAGYNNFKEVRQNRAKRKETDRFHVFTYAELMKRDKASLDLLAQGRKPGGRRQPARPQRDRRGDRRGPAGRVG
jgi:hypothetical protein